MATFVKTKILCQREWEDPPQTVPVEAWINADQILRVKPIGEIEHADFTEIEFANGERNTVPEKPENFAELLEIASKAL